MQGEGLEGGTAVQGEGLEGGAAMYGEGLEGRAAGGPWVLVQGQAKTGPVLFRYYVRFMIYEITLVS